MTFLDRTVCSCCGGATTTIGDLFKLVVPVGWTFVAIAACLAYLVSPLSRGDSPRWGSACLVAFSALAGIGLSSAVYGFHRKTSSFAIEENYTTTAAAAAANSGTAAETPPDAGATSTEATLDRIRALRIHSLLSLGASVAAIVLAVFFGVYAPGMDMCAHESCGADVSWSLITLVVSVLWMGVTLLGHRDLQKVLLLYKTSFPEENEGEGMDMPREQRNY